MNNHDFLKSNAFKTVFAFGAVGGIGAYRIVRRFTKSLGLDSTPIGKALDIYIALLISKEAVKAGIDLGAHIYASYKGVRDDMKVKTEVNESDFNDDGIHFDDASDVENRGPRVIK